MQSLPSQLIVYGSAETHNCVIKGIEVVGIGSEHFRKVPVDENYCIRPEALEQIIAEDIAAGHTPFCIIGNAGTVNTGAIDPLTELAAIAKKNHCWFHVDGAFGAIPKILPEFQERLQGIELADSLAFDYHKWLYVNYEVACVLIRMRKRIAKHSPLLSATWQATSAVFLQGRILSAIMEWNYREDSRHSKSG